MRTPSKRSLHLYLSGAFERLYLGAGSRLSSRVHRRPPSVPLLYLCEGDHRYWAAIAPVDAYTGRVAWSNVIPSGALVRSKKSWRFAAMRKAPGRPQTLGSPRFLRILWLPPRPKGDRGRPPRFASLRKFVLVA